MLKFLLFFLIPVIIIIFIFSIISKVVRAFRPRTGPNGSSRKRSGTYNNQTDEYDSQQKQFSKEEGEYVDYEEIKDE